MKVIRELLPNVPILALTATATNLVVDDIQAQLYFREKRVFRMSFARTNLTYIVQNSEDKLADLMHLLEQSEGSAIVYTRPRGGTRDTARALQTAGAQKGQPTDDAAPVTLSKIRIAHIPTDYPLFVAGGFHNPQNRFEQTFTTNISPDGAKKITRTFYLPESVSEAYPGAIVYFTFSKHGEEKEVALLPKIRDKNNLTVAGYNDGVRGVASLVSIVRNVHYEADVEVKGWDENVVNFSWNVQPWEKETSTQDFIPAVVENAASNANNPFAGQDGVSVPAGHPNWVDLDPAATDRVTFKFKVKKPEGAHWRFTLTNNLDFEFVDERFTYGLTSDNTITFAVRTRKPYTGTLRTTELYLTVDGKEVQIVKGFNANNVGPTKRILIRQTS